jgi:hypothetical protein
MGSYQTQFQMSQDMFPSYIQHNTNGRSITKEHKREPDLDGVQAGVFACPCYHVCAFSVVADCSMGSIKLGPFNVDVEDVPSTFACNPSPIHRLHDEYD